MSRDLRKYTQQTNIRIVAGAILLLFIIGLGLIWLIYGLSAAMGGLLCLLGAFVPIALIYFALYGLDWIVKRANRDD